MLWEHNDNFASIRARKSRIFKQEYSISFLLYTEGSRTVSFINIPSRADKFIKVLFKVNNEYSPATRLLEHKGW